MIQTTRPPMWRRYLRFWGPDIEADVKDELDFHIDMRAQELIESGWPRNEAHQEALRLFGDMQDVRSECRSIDKRREKTLRRAALFTDLRQDLGYAVRVLLQKPGFSVVVVLSLALGIGANTALFTLTKAVLLEQLPVKNPEELVLFNWEEGPNKPRFMVNGWLRRTDTGLRTSTSFSYSAFQSFQKREGVLTELFAFARLYRLNVNLFGEAEIADGLLVSSGYFSGLGVSAALGRLIGAADNHAASEPVVVISHGYWQRRCGADPAVVGRSMSLNGNLFTIIGVAPAGFKGTAQVDNAPSLYVPLALGERVKAQSDGLQKADVWWLHILGRLESGVSIEAAEAMLAPVLRQTIDADFGLVPDSEDGEPSREDRLRLVLTPGGRGMNEVREELAEPLFIAQVVIGLVLLIACANVATLLLARSEERRREMAVRLSLGAGRFRLIRQLLTESLLLALVGGALGLLVSQWGASALLTLLPVSSNAVSAIRLEPDAQVLAFTLFASVVTGVIFGMVPALRTSQVRPVPLLKAGGRAVGPGGTSRWGLARGLVVVQVALSLILLVTAGLFVRSFQNLMSQEPGLNARGVLLFRIDPTLNGYADERLASLYQQILSDIQSLPGVSSATMSPYSPIGTSGRWDDLTVPGGNEVGTRIRFIDVGFMETLEIPLLLGRGLTSRDSAKSPFVALVNEAFAREAFGDANPLGRQIHIREKQQGPKVEIIGVYRDSRDLGLREGTYPAVFLPYQQHLEHLSGMTFSVRSHHDPEPLLGLVRDRVKEVDPNLPLFETKTLAQKIESMVAQEKRFVHLSTLSGGLALLLACIGIYGTLSASVSRRTQEIGIRMALGAQRGDILSSVMRGMFMVALGVGIGLSGAWALTRWLSSLLFQLTATDPMTLLVAVLVLVVVAAIAVYIPARRASLVEPMVALRFE